MIKWKVFVLVCLGLLTYSQSKASHIVGGEFELVYLSGNQYKLNLNLYFDVLNGSEGARESLITAAIYRKRDHTLIDIVTIPLISSRRVDYFQPSCSNGEVVTDKLIYSTNIQLSADIYNDPEGYYVAWERCCRNYVINNIFSSDPNADPSNYAGQTFYLEFPPVEKNGQPFRNSSPILFPPLNDYACPNRAYWVDFQGTDNDGDSLVYSLVTPLSTHHPSAYASNGSAEAGPYPVIKWRSGFGLHNIMKGAPDLVISPDGFLTVTPTVQGLFVFAVKVEEYRDSVKIGEVRRDFQLLVVDKCPAAEAPVVKGKKLTEGSYTYKENMNVTFPAGTPDDQRCIEIQITDPDALKPSDEYREEVFIKAIPLGFKEDVEGILPEDITATLVNGSGATFKICFEECPYLKSGSFQIGIVAFDDACALPLSDTLRINVYVEPPPNNEPYFLDRPEYNVNVVETAGGVFTRDFLARDADNDSLTISIKPVGFNPADHGITLNPGNNKPGEVEALLEWNYDCQKYSFDGMTSFPFILTVDDKDYCQFADEDKLKLTLNIELPPNTEPDVNISLNTDEDNYHSLEQAINKKLVFNVTGKDDDNDLIKIEGSGTNFKFSDHKIIFNSKEGSGLPQISTPFSWELTCDFNLALQDSFNLHFYVEDLDKCQITNRDTIVVDLKLLPPSSVKPVTNAFALGNTTLNDQKVKITVGEKIELKLVGADSDIDNITLTLDNINELNLAEFPTATGKGQVSSNFIWQPDCRIFNGRRDSVIVTGNFILADDNCYDPKSDTLSIDFVILDTEDFLERFKAPNVITPNNDEKNDFFVLENIFNVDGSERSMPEDNCAGQFKKIEIFNRWGRKIYESSQREFKWKPDKEPAGMYYYYLSYSDKSFKGFIHVLF